jgi:hypothetical protein
VLQPVDSSILHEIVRIIESRRRVPERVQVRGREYQITYLEDHQRRLEEALHRFDSDQLNMLYGQLASKVKYQQLRRVPAREAKGKKKTAARRASGAKTTAARKSAAKRAKPAKRRPAEKRAARKPAVKKAAKKAAKKTTKKKAPARKAGAKKTGARKK